MVIDLKASYLETLSIGMHTLSALFDDGIATTNFLVAGQGESVTPRRRSSDYHFRPWTVYDWWLSPHDTPHRYGGTTLRDEDSYKSDDAGDTNAKSATATAITNKPTDTASILTRLAGANRYQTMAKVSSEGLTSSKYAVIATGDDFPDALSASGLAGTFKCPVVLTPTHSLSGEATSELKRLGVSEVYVMGGERAVSAEVAKALEASDITVRRVFGSDRMGTSVRVLSASREAGSVSDTVVVVSGTSFAACHERSAKTAHVFVNKRTFVVS